MKKIIILCLCVLTLCVGCGCNKKDNKKDNETKQSIINESKEFTKNQTINNVEISNVRLEYVNNISTFTATVTNKDKSNKKINIVDIIIKDKDKKEIIILKGLIEKVLNTNSSVGISASVGLDLRNAEYVEYKIR